MKSTVGKRWKCWVAAAALGAGLFGGAAAVPSRAHACGGLFCSSAQPVNQAAERIIFSFDQTKKQVTAVVEILYSGPAEKFAWVLPVPGVPTVGVSTSAVLDRLQAMTNPLYSVARVWPDNVCGGRGVPGSAGQDAAASPTAPNSEGTPGVSVLASGSVGPYVYDVIMVNPDPAVTDKAMVALKWLTDNGYDVGGLGREVLQPYLRDGLNLIAFKLQKNQTAGSIRPVMLTYDSAHPMIPIVPTKVAANPDMGILVFVLGARRAVPINYKSLELNEALIDWFNPNTTYNAVVSAAADEAKGQGFVTELAGPTAVRNYALALYQESSMVTDYRRMADEMTTLDLLVHVIERFATFGQANLMGPFGSRPVGGMRVALDGVTDVLTTNLKLPAGVTLAQLMARPRCYLTPGVAGAVYCEGAVAPTPAERIDLSTFNRTKFMLDIESLVIQPLEKTAQLFAAQPYLTRLYTTMSPAEMTLDPTFDLSTGLPDVDNNHSVTLTYTGNRCGDTSGAWTADIGGLTVRGTGNTWPHDLKAAKMPFNRRILQMTSDRPPVVEADNTTVIARALGSPVPTMPSGTGGAGADAGAGGSTGGTAGGSLDAGTGTAGGGKGGGCSLAGGGGGGAFALIGMAGLIALLRRRRAR